MSVRPRVVLAAAVAVLVAGGPTLGASEEIRLLGGTFNPKNNVKVLGPWKAQTGPEVSGSKYILVRVDGHLTEALENKLASKGIRLIRHFQGAWFLAQAKGVPKAGIKEFLNVTGVEVAEIDTSKKLRLWPGSGITRRPYLVRSHEPLGDDKAAALFQSIRPGLIASRSKRCDCWSVELTDDEAKKLAKANVVSSIDPDDPRIVPLMDAGRAALGADLVQSFTGSSASYSFAGLAGAGTVGAVLDVDGALPARPFFFGVDPKGATTTTRLSNLASSEAQHATWMAGIIGGNGVAQTAGNWQYLGIAPAASLVTVNAYNNNVAAFFAALHDKFADLTNNSYAVSEYDIPTFSRYYDRLVRGEESFDPGTGAALMPSRPAVFSAGNNGQGQASFTPNWVGYYSILNPTKNGVVVGGCVITIDAAGRPTCAARAGCSSIGPTFDGRLKPDVVAPADKQDAASNQMAFMLPTLSGSSNLYLSQAQCGTSFAAAYVSGVVLLMTEEWNKINPAERPYPSTLKAALINTAVDLVGISEGPYSSTLKHGIPVEAFAGPDYATGYGEVSATGAIDTIAAGRIREATLINQGDTIEYEVEVPSGAAEFRITLAWDDVSSATPSDLDVKQLENDLDLEVTPPLGTVQAPLTLTSCVKSSSHTKTTIPGCAVAATPNTPDHVNNVEQFVAAGPAPGTWKVTVRAYDLPFNDPQTFSLASSASFAPELDEADLQGSIGSNSILSTVAAKQATIELAGLNEGHSVVVPLGPFCWKAKCPSCERYGKCPPIDIQLESFPDPAKLTIVDGKGRRLGEVVRTDATHASMTWPRDKRNGAFLVVKTSVKLPPSSQPPRLRAIAKTDR